MDQPHDRAGCFGDRCDLGWLCRVDECSSRQEEFGICGPLEIFEHGHDAVIGKASILGVLAGTVGVVIGLLIAQMIGVLLTDRIEPFNWSWSWLLISLLVTPLVAALASLAPSIWIASRDPSRVLSGE